MMKGTEAVSAAGITRWDHAADVVVVGYGIAGACAALEAQRAGAEVLMIERASGGGGTSALSSGIFYLGGGTKLQEAVGVEDDPDAMYRFLLASTGVSDPALLRVFCDRSVEHFDWLEAQGIPFERSYFKGKSLCPVTSEGLVGTGNEKVWPFREIARPAARGHRVAREGDNAGALAMERLLQRCAEAGFATLYDSRVDALILHADGNVAGVRVVQGRETLHVAARRGVILATGGFQMDHAMVRHYAPHFAGQSEPIGISYNDGAGIRLGLGAGAALHAMSAINATACFYPPGQLLKGIIVNARGERFVAEDSYHGRTAAFVAEQPGGIAYLILDAETFAYPDLEDFFQHRLVDGWETIAAMERGLDLPEGSLQRTLAEYNRHAAEGRDPLLGKYEDWLTPLDAAPYAAFDLSLDRAIHRFHTLGGLEITAEAQVVSTEGKPIPGLYAAGACAAGIPQDSRGYASGMTLATGSLFGRIAGRYAMGLSISGGRPTDPMLA
jgi:succinate dehydrogenase/fumarate reductase flavoprotein subunit